MIRRFPLSRVLNIFLFCLSLFILFNLFFGERNIFILDKKSKELSEIKDEIKILKNQKKKIQFEIDMFKKNNKDFQESIIREKLHYKSKNEKIIFY